MCTNVRKLFIACVFLWSHSFTNTSVRELLVYVCLSKKANGKPCDKPLRVCCCRSSHVGFCLHYEPAADICLHYLTQTVDKKCSAFRSFNDTAAIKSSQINTSYSRQRAIHSDLRCVYIAASSAPLGDCATVQQTSAA